MERFIKKWTLGDSSMFTSNRPLLGIENEFLLYRKPRSVEGDLTELELTIDKMIDALPSPVFRKEERSVRLNTGGAFYLDGIAPEVTSAPFYIEPGAVSGVVTNLFQGRRLVSDSVERVNRKEGLTLSLGGYSAHYNFSFPSLRGEQAKLATVIASSVSPALYLLLENKKSCGIMIRYRLDGRLEFCGDYIPRAEQNQIVVGYIIALLSYIDTQVQEGATISEIEQELGYSLPASRLSESKLRPGWVFKSPEIKKKGRKARLTVTKNGTKRTYTMTAQEVLEHYFSRVESTALHYLTLNELEIVREGISGKRKLPIDYRGLPHGYHSISSTVSPTSGSNPLAKALGSGMKEREVGTFSLRPVAMEWGYTTYLLVRRGEEYKRARVAVPLDLVIDFEALVHRCPDLIERILGRKVTTRELHRLESAGIDNPLQLVRQLSERQQSTFS